MSLLPSLPAPAAGSPAPVVVLGGGAAGFFGAIACAEAAPGRPVYLLEKTPKLLSKVRVSGGGRCNVTHACESAAQLMPHYPRGGRGLKEAFQQFGVADTVAWFQRRGVALKTEADGRMFPTTDSSETIAQALEQAARQAGVRVLTRTSVAAIEPLPGGGFQLALGGEGSAGLGGYLGSEPPAGGHRRQRQARGLRVATSTGPLGSRASALAVHLQRASLAPA